MNRKQWNDIYDRLYAVYGECTCPLRHETPFQLLAAVIIINILMR